MRRSADVKSLDALKDAKAAVVEFRETVGIALAEAQSEVQRMLWWLQNDRAMYWQHEVRRRSEKVNQAKSELYRAKLASMGELRDCIDQKKDLEKAERNLEIAEQKIVLVKKWVRAMEREYMLFKGKIQPIARAVDGDLPRAEAKLENLIDKLDKYVRLAAPASDRPRATSRSARDGADDRAAPEEETDR